MNVSNIASTPNAGRFGTAALFDFLSTSSRAPSSDALDLLTAGKGASMSFADAMSGFSLPTPSSAETAKTALSGRNELLADPESAYRMMSLINKMEVSYKGQFAEMSDMKDFVTRLEQTGADLRTLDSSVSDESIVKRVQAFVDQYNQWDQRFDADMENGGLLAGTQAAQVARYELKQSIENRFNGARDGLQGLEDLGITVDAATGQATLDTTKLTAMLAEKRTGAVHTLQEFGANFEKSADLLNSAGNFIPNRLSNLDRVIDYIADNRTALRQEFGNGDDAKPTGLVAKALAAYESMTAK